MNTRLFTVHHSSARVAKVSNFGCFVFPFFTGPGPGRYALPTTTGYQKHDFTKRCYPAYSFGTRLDNSSKQCCDRDVFQLLKRRGVFPH